MSKNGNISFLNKLKNNKVKVSVASFSLAAILGVALGLGYASNISSGNRLPIDIYQPEINVVPGEIEFDDNGKLIIPKLEDKDNPSGVYENKVDHEAAISEQDKASIISANSDSFYEELDASLNEKASSMIDLFPEETLSQEIMIDSKINSLVDYYIPVNNISADTLTVKDFAQLLYSDVAKNNVENSIDFNNITDLMALCGINFDKEYNAVAESCNDEIVNYNVTLYGGGGSYPQPPVLPPMDDSQIPTDPVHQVTMRTIYDSYVVDQRTRLMIEVIYATLAITISIVSLVLAIITGGWSILSAAIDLIFCGIAIAFAVLEFTQSGAMLDRLGSLWKSTVFAGYDLLSFNISMFQSVNFFYGDYAKYKEIKNNFKWFRNNTFSNLKMSQVNAKILSMKVSVFAAGLVLIKIVLDEVLDYNTNFFDLIDGLVEEIENQNGSNAS